MKYDLIALLCFLFLFSACQQHTDEMIESEVELTFRLSVNEFEQIPFTRGLSEPAHLLIIDKFGNDVKCVEKSSFDPFVMMLAFGVHEFYFVAAENKWSSFDTEHLQLTWHDDSTGLGRVWACRMSIDVGKTSLEENIILPLVVADVKVEVLDRWPPQVATIELQASGLCHGLDLATMTGISMGNVVQISQRITSEEHKIQNFDLLTFVPSSGNVGNLILRANNAEYETLATKTVTDVVVQQGTISRYSGYLIDVNSDLYYTLSPNFGKSLGIFGGSFSNIEESDSCKFYWQEKLQLTLFGHGINGAGYSVATHERGVQYAVDGCCRRDEPHDIYLLWSPSNDFSKGRATIGTLSDYTEADGFDTAKLTTMLGGMNYSYQKLKQKNPDAEILLFTTLPIFNKGAAGYDTLYTDSIGLRHYVDAQIEWAKAHDVPYLDLFRRSGFTHSNYGPYYQNDKLHPNVEGYKHLVDITLPFLAYPH